ncbi:hypothetical protein FB451DRAFT_1447709 [Mycena latifolia]|nr:hypothetical protein FB451DRAFT_1447709 [Mycena latifolia]
MKAFPSSFVTLAVAAAAPLVLAATATVQVGQATLLDPTVSSDTCGIPISAADLYAAVARTPGGDSRCGETINVQFGDASVNLTVADQCPACVDPDIEMTQAAYTALGAPVGPVTVAWIWVGCGGQD